MRLASSSFGWTDALLRPKALKLEGVKQQHDMRIAAKRLRYVLEATEFCFGRTGQVARRRARDLQGDPRRAP